MRVHRIAFAVVAVIALLPFSAFATSFVVFPKAAQLPSPDGRFVVRDGEPSGTSPDFNGISHSLWLVDQVTGHSRKLCDYLGLAAVAWSGNDFILVTQYVGRRTSRALVFSIATDADPVLLDEPTLTRLVPAELRPTLRENNRIFIEASGVEKDTLHLTVWGYGPHDANGFHWSCEYSLRDGVVSCTEQHASH